jgi:hypothetical protein
MSGFVSENKLGSIDDDNRSVGSFDALDNEDPDKTADFFEKYLGPNINDISKEGFEQLATDPTPPQPCAPKKKCAKSINPCLRCGAPKIN